MDHQILNKASTLVLITYRMRLEMSFHWQWSAEANGPRSEGLSIP